MGRGGFPAAGGGRNMERKLFEEAHLAYRDAFCDPHGACFYGGTTGIMEEIVGRPMG